MPFRRQHAGTVGGASEGAAVASHGQQTASNANVSLTRMLKRFYAHESANFGFGCTGNKTYRLAG